MARDIDSIIHKIREMIPEVNVVQMHKTHAVDDDGLWWFRLPNAKKDIQIESSTGNCPFLIETDDDTGTSSSKQGSSVELTTAIIFEDLSQLKQRG